jgi:predicted dinucleotide-binding enzyme
VASILKNCPGCLQTLDECGQKRTVMMGDNPEALAAGHEVALSCRRGPESLAGKVAELGHGASAATVEAAASLDYVLLAVPWPNVEDALRGLPAWNGRTNNISPMTTWATCPSRTAAYHLAVVRDSLEAVRVNRPIGRSQL